MSAAILTRAAALVSRPAAPVPARARGWSLPEVRWAAAATALFAAGLAARLAHGPAWLAWTLFLACYAAGGWEPGLAGLRALRERRLDVDLLMVVAAVGAAAIGQVLDGGLLIVIFATSGALEAVATHRTAQAVRGLLDLAPDRAVRLTARRRRGDRRRRGLDAGDVILVRPGERIAADGQVLDGASDVDQATITGEPLPVAKEPGDEVFAGTLNGTGALPVRVSRAAADTVIARIAAMVEEASATKARTQLFIEKVEQRYSLGMVTATVLLFAVPLLAGEAFQASLLRAMTFMIVASPCAVVLATMPPLLSAMANAGRHGVLVKSAVAMEKAAGTGVVAFDKTGTLTEGTPRLAAIRVLPGSGRERAAGPGAGRRRGEPVGAPAGPGGRRRRTGSGTGPAGRHRVQRAARPRRHRAGRRAAGLDRQPGGNRLETRPSAPWSPRSMEEDGQTAAVVAVDGEPVAVLGIADRIRQEAARTVARIAALTGTPPVLLTGDNQRAAARLAVAGRHHRRAGRAAAGRQGAGRAGAGGRGRSVLLAGDGVNDAPAMAAASTGAAMGRAGSDLALDTADIVIMRDDLAVIPAVIALARRARRVVTANLVIAAVIIAALVTWDLAGHLPLPLGVLGHEGSTVIVGLNGLRLLPSRAWVKVTR